MGELVDTLGGRTEDLNALQLPHPAERNLPKEDAEANLRRIGTRMLTGGIGTGFFAALLALGTAIATGTGSWGSELADLLALLGITALMSVGAAMVAVGGMERVGRPGRAAVRLAILADEKEQQARKQDREAVRAIAHSIEDLANSAPAQLRAVEQRLAQLEQTVAAQPGYGQGVIEGMQIRTSAFGSGE